MSETIEINADVEDVIEVLDNLEKKIVVCPKCGVEIDHYEHIGTEENRVCPVCKEQI